MKQKRLNKSGIKRAASYFKRNGIKASYYKVIERLIRDRDEARLNEDVFDIISDMEALGEQAAREFKVRHKFSIIVPAYETDAEYFEQMLESVISQAYDNWELCIADASRTDIVKNTLDSFFENSDAYKNKIKYVRLPENKGISANTNEALKLATGQYAAFLDHDDKLHQSALFEAMCLLDNYDYKLIYTDEDKFSEDNAHFDIHIKPDFNLELLRTNNYICHFLIVKLETALSIGGFRSEYDGSQDHDFILRAAEKLKREEIAHIPKLLYHWRSHGRSTATNPDSKLYAYDAGKRAVRDHLERLSIKASVTDTPHLGFYRVKYSVSAEDLARVQIMTLDELKSLPMEELRNADFEYIMILSDDLRFKSYEFIEDMLGYLMQDGVGCVGGLIIGKDGKIESAGYETSPDGDLTPMFAGLNRHFSGYMHRARLAREADAVCTDCMMIKKQAVGCGCVLKPEYRVIYSPYSVFKRVK